MKEALLIASCTAPTIVIFTGFWKGEYKTPKESINSQGSQDPASCKVRPQNKSNQTKPTIN